MSALIPGDWALDYSTDTPILLHKKCSVIEGEHAKELYQFILEIPQIESLKKELAKANGQGMLVEDMNNAQKSRFFAQATKDYIRINGELSASITELESALSAERAKNARIVADRDNAWEQFRRMRNLLAEAKYGDRLQNQVIAMKGTP